MARLFATQATAAEVVETIRKARAGVQDTASRVRTVMFKLQGDRVGLLPPTTFNKGGNSIRLR